jgi:hypothetical protein
LARLLALVRQQALLLVQPAQRLALPSWLLQDPVPLDANPGRFCGKYC